MNGREHRWFLSDGSCSSAGEMIPSLYLALTCSTFSILSPSLYRRRVLQCRRDDCHLSLSLALSLSCSLLLSRARPSPYSPFLSTANECSSAGEMTGTDPPRSLYLALTARPSPYSLLHARRVSLPLPSSLPLPLPLSLSLFLSVSLSLPFCLRLPVAHAPQPFSLLPPALSHARLHALVSTPLAPAPVNTQAAPADPASYHEHDARVPHRSKQQRQPQKQAGSTCRSGELPRT